MILLQGHKQRSAPEVAMNPRGVLGEVRSWLLQRQVTVKSCFILPAIKVCQFFKEVCGGLRRVPGTSTVPWPQVILQNYRKWSHQALLCAGCHQAVSCIHILSHALFCTGIFSPDIDRCTGNTYYSCLQAIKIIQLGFSWCGWVLFAFNRLAADLHRKLCLDSGEISF